MKVHKVNNPGYVLTVLLFIILFMGGCVSPKMQNFNRQKYLHGKIKPSYPETETDQQSDVANTEEYSTSEIPEQTNLNEKQNQPEVSSHPDDNLHTFPKSIPDINAPKNHPESLAKEATPKVKPKKILQRIRLGVRHSPKLSPGEDISITWVLILTGLALLALPFAFLIGFWAFIIAGVLLVAAAIVLASSDWSPSTGSIIGDIFLTVIFAVVIGVLAALLCVAIVVVLIWLLIWGIIQLVN